MGKPRVTTRQRLTRRFLNLERRILGLLGFCAASRPNAGSSQRCDSDRFEVEGARFIPERQRTSGRILSDRMPLVCRTESMRWRLNLSVGLPFAISHPAGRDLRSQATMKDTGKATPPADAIGHEPAGRLRRPVQQHQYEERVLLVLTLIIGAVVGLAVVLFIVVTENLGGRLYPPASAPWRRVAVPIAGSLIAGILLHRYFPNARGSGIPQTKLALFLQDGQISFRTVLGKFSLCSLSLASGAALGREGPSVHVGAGIASTLGRKLRLSPASIKALAGCGKTS
jgi:hypothetical protein